MKPRRPPTLVLLLSAATLLLNSCSQPDSAPLYQSSRVAMGTFVEVKIPGRGKDVQAAAEAIFDELKRIEDLASFHKTSGLSRINSESGTGPIQAEPELLQLIGKGLRVAEETRGAFDPTVGSLTRLWQFSGGEPRLPDPAEIAQALKRVGWDKVKLDIAANTIDLTEPNMALDLGGIAKGYALDRASQLIKKLGINSALVNLGGDILVVGERSPGNPWRIGVQDPRDQTNIVAVASVINKVIVTSGDYQRFFINNGNRYHHILDPHTGNPARGLQSVTLVAPNGITAEPLAVAVFVMGVQRGLKHIESMQDVQGFLIDQEGEIHTSAGADSVFEMKK
jgi:FAD:protein FMN transferase